MYRPLVTDNGVKPGPPPTTNTHTSPTLTVMDMLLDAEAETDRQKVGVDARDFLLAHPDPEAPSGSFENAYFVHTPHNVKQLWMMSSGGSAQTINPFLSDMLEALRAAAPSLCSRLSARISIPEYVSFSDDIFMSFLERVDGVEVDSSWLSGMGDVGDWREDGIIDAAQGLSVVAYDTETQAMNRYLNGYPRDAAQERRLIVRALSARTGLVGDVGFPYYCLVAKRSSEQLGKRYVPYYFLTPERYKVVSHSNFVKRTCRGMADALSDHGGHYGLWKFLHGNLV